MSIILTPVQGERHLIIENRRIQGQKWRLCIPEVFIAERDSDRFLKCSGPDAQEYPITVQWHENNNQVSYTWTNEGAEPVPLEYRVWASAEDDSVDLQFTVKNIGQTKWPKLFSAAVCLRNKEAISFIDPNGKRTILFSKRGPETAWDLEEKLQLMPIIKWSPIPFYVGIPKYPARENWKEVQHGLIVRASVDNSWNVAFGWDKVAMVEAVLGIDSVSCIHSHPQFEKLSPGDSLTRYGKIWFSQDGPDEILQRYMAFIAKKRSDPV